MVHMHGWWVVDAWNGAHAWMACDSGSFSLTIGTGKKVHSTDKSHIAHTSDPRNGP